MGIDRSDYATHLRETNKDQMLLNIVAMRYGDAPLFLEVSSVISQYTREGSVSASVPVAPPVGNSDAAGSAAACCSARPRRSPTPRSRRPFRAQPALADSAGFAARPDRVRLVDRPGVPGGRAIDQRREQRQPQPAVRPLGRSRVRPGRRAMARVQRSRALVLHVERGPEAQFSAHASLSPQPSAQDREDLAYLVRALNLPGDGRGEFKVAFGDGQIAPDTLTLGTRSMFEIFSEMAQGVEVPARDAGGRTIETSAGRPVGRR
jgi:hypothetical protein